MSFARLGPPECFSCARSRGNPRSPTPNSIACSGRSDRLNELIGQILMLSRLNREPFRYLMRPSIFPHWSPKFARTPALRPTVLAGSVEVIGSTPIVMTGTAGLIRGAIENVVRNAVRYTPENSVVEVNLSCLKAAGPPCALIQVRDHGPGIPEDKLDDIFRPFYRIAEGHKRETGGPDLDCRSHTGRSCYTGHRSAVNVPPAVS